MTHTCRPGCLLLLLPPQGGLWLRLRRPGLGLSRGDLIETQV